MKRYALVLMSLIASSVLATPSESQRREWGQLVMENIPEIPAELKERLNQYENVRSASFQGWLPDDRGVLISTRFGEASQLHSVAAPWHDRRQITFFDEPVAGAFINPKKAELVFLKDIGGNENSQIYLMDLQTSAVRLLTDGKSRNESPRWNERGDTLAFSSSMRNGRDTDIYLIRPGDAQSVPELLIQEGGSWAPVAFSHDHNRLLVRRTVSVNESYMYILDLKTRKLEQLFPEKTFAYQAAAWSLDNRSLYLVMDIDGEFQTLYHYDLQSKQRKALTAQIPWDIGGLEIAPDGRTIAFVSNEGGIDRLYLMDTRSHRFEMVKALPATSLIGRMEFHPRNPKRLGITLSSGTSPGDVFVYDIGRKQLQAWTESELGGLNRSRFVEPQLVQFPSFDQVEGQARLIPAFIYRPRQKNTKVPVVINIHGGPEAQARPSFSPSFQYLAAEMGVAVITPNVRGSSGYGKTFLKLDNGFRREDAVKDIGALLDWIAQQPDLDSKRVLVMGGSYGGYMTLASLVHYSDRLAGGISSVGISHFLTFLANTKSYRQDLRRVEYGDERDPEMRAFLDRISPLTQVAKIQKPLFVVQGLNDPRVPASESEQIVKAVRSQGQEVWYLLARDEGHGFRKKANQEVLLQTNMMFIEKVLQGKQQSAAR